MATGGEQGEVPDRFLAPGERLAGRRRAERVRRGTPVPVDVFETTLFAGLPAGRTT